MDVSGIIHERWPLENGVNMKLNNDIENQLQPITPITENILNSDLDYIINTSDTDNNSIVSNENQHIALSDSPIPNTTLDSPSKTKIPINTDDNLTRSFHTYESRRYKAPSITFTLHEKIEGNYRDKGRWYPGKITKVNNNNTYNIKYDDGEYENNKIVNCIRKYNTDNNTVSSITVDDRINTSRIFTPNEFKELQNNYNKFSKNGNSISRNQFEILIDEYEHIDIRELRDLFLDEYLKHLGRNYTFLDYYTIVNHLRNLQQIRSKKLLTLTDTIAEDKINKRKMDMSLNIIYDEVEIERQKLNIDKLKYDLSKEKELLISKQKYENEVKLYSKDLYGLTCYGFLYKTYKKCFGQNIIKDFDNIYEIIRELPTLNNYEKNLILIRFQSILIYCIKHYNIISRWYNSTQIFLIACSIANPALLSINSDRENVNYYSIFWSVWISQLLVSLVTSYVSFFKWDKKYFLFNAYKTKINQEIWLYIELSGNHYKEGSTNNHSKQLNKFLNRLEYLYKRLKMSEFEIETTNNDEETNNNKEKSNKQSVEDIMQSRQMVVDEDERNRRNLRREEY